MANTKTTDKKRPSAEEIRAYSFFVVYNNPRKHGIAGITTAEMEHMTNEDICRQTVEAFCNTSGKSATVLYCVSAAGLEHIHAVFCGVNQLRLTTLKKFLGPPAHIEITRGDKAQVEAYINKTGKFEEKGEAILAKAQIGEIKGTQGKRTDIMFIREAIDKGLNWHDVVRLNDRFYDGRMTTIIKNMYFDKRFQETPLKRKVDVHWVIGGSGSGKTGTIFQLAEEYGADNIFLVSDYKAPFDGYAGEKIIVMDEFRGQMAYSVLLDVTEGYRKQVHCRNTNVWSLWDAVYITTIKTPEEVYAKMIDAEDADSDPIGQLLGRLKDISYCYRVNRPTGTKKDRDGEPAEFYRYTISGKAYREMKGTKIEEIKKSACTEYNLLYAQPGDVVEAFDIGTTKTTTKPAGVETVPFGVLYPTIPPEIAERIKHNPIPYLDAHPEHKPISFEEAREKITKLCTL